MPSLSFEGLEILLPKKIGGILRAFISDRKLFSKNNKGPLPPFNLSLGYYDFSLADHFGYTLYLYITIALSTSWFTFAISWGTFRSASPVSKFRQIFLNFIKHVEIWTLPHESTESKIHKFTCNFSKFVNYKLHLKC